MKPFIVKSSALALLSNAVNMPVRVISSPVIAIVALLSQPVVHASVKSDAEAGKKVDSSTIILTSVSALTGLVVVNFNWY